MTDPKKVTAREAEIIENFMATLGDSTLQEALGNAELDAASYRLSRAAARELGGRIRTHFTRSGK